MDPAGRQIEDGPPGSLAQVGPELDREERAGAGHVQRAVGTEGERVGVVVAAADDDRLIGDPVTVAIGQRHHAIVATLGDEQGPVGGDGHETRPDEAVANGVTV